MFGPAIGAGILIFFSKGALIIVSIIIFALSIIPLLKLRHLKNKPPKPSLSFREFFQHARERKNYLSIAFFSIHSSAEGVLFPLFIFIIFESIQSVALIPIIVSVTALIFSYFARKIKRADREKMIILGGFLITFIWVLRLIVDLPFFYYISIFFVGLFSLLVTIPLDSNLFARGKSRDPLSTSMYRNTISMFAKLLFYGTLAILISVFKVSFVFALLGLFGLIAVNYVFLYFDGKTAS